MTRPLPHPVDSHTWIATVTARHIDERLRSADAPSLVRTTYDRHTYREFAAMIGAGDARTDR